jgi:hypothetical protein
MAIKSKREPLVYAHLENGSRALLEHHSDIVRRRIGKNPGIYALYKGGRLYYVGLASSLSARLKAHLRDRHKDAWDQFAIYLTIKDQHIRELESLLLRIAKPKGNAVSGKPKGSHNMSGDIRTEVRNKQRREWIKLIGGVAPTEKVALKEPDKKSWLRRIFPDGATIRATYKGTVITGRIRRDGKVKVDGHIFGSLSLAAKHVRGYSTVGSKFWSVERGAGNWIKVSELRRAGTPLLRSAKQQASAKRVRNKRKSADTLLQARRSEIARKAWRTRRARIEKSSK